VSHPETIAARLAGGDVLKIAPASKLGCYGIGVVPRYVSHLETVAARLAGGSDLEDVPAGKPCCYRRE
jgi:hypothetical protein